MKIQLVSTASYDPPRGGSTRSNLVWLENLAGAGHSCRVVCGLPIGEITEERESSPCAGLTVLSVSDTRRRDVLRREIASFHPDVVLVSSEDLSHTMLREAYRLAPDRVVYLAHTPQFYPFGPAAWNTDAEAASLVARCAGVVAIAEFTAQYIREYGKCEATVIHPPIYGKPPFRRLGKADSGAIAMINPCAMKGISIFLALARRFPHLPFAALPGWGTTDADRRELDSLPNFQWLKTCADIELMLKETRLLLMPSLWLEGFGLIVVEAMLRGIPVLASDAGGLRESSLGAGFRLPIHTIREFTTAFDDRHLPVPVVPPQDIEPWASTIAMLERDSGQYEKESESARQAAEKFVARWGPEHFERFLENLSKGDTIAPAATDAASHPAANLSTAKRDLLLRRLRGAHLKK